MLIKIEIIEIEPGEAFVYRNPYPDRDIFVASKQQATRLTTREQDIQFASEKKRSAWRLGPNKEIAYRAAVGALIYVKTERPINSR
ncbi:MAG: hypothetical protein Q8O55_02280 [Dehalococcoidales bacterium]|nr:hypothetical protein [Dehalococcoidales bacterium]